MMKSLSVAFAACFCLFVLPSVLNGQVRSYYGRGTSTTLGVGFAVKITLDTSAAPAIAGQFDATGLPGETVICGRGNYTGTIVGNAISFSFLDGDNDPGCGGGGATFIVNASMSASGDILNGTYSSNTGQQGSLTVHRAERWSGLGFNDPFSAPWRAELLLANVSATVIAGELDATQPPGGATICGRGIFVGTRTGSEVEFKFTSNDPDPGCGFDFGDIDTFNGEVSSNGMSMSGSYVIDNGQDGLWAVTRESIFRDGFESGNSAQWSSTAP
jgi:hypothetical protein